MTIFLYDTVSRMKREFVPADANNVTVYVCGPTVSDIPHIGNMRSAVVFDVLHRVLRNQYGKDAVSFVTNITDIDDKIMAKALDRDISIAEHTAETTEQYLAVREKLNLLTPWAMPKATSHITQIIMFILRLIESNNAYVADGHVLFSVASNPAHGGLSQMPLDELRGISDHDRQPYKREPADFVLWKPSDLSMPGWDSPWGRGRPGWHIECSAMIAENLGETIDIHGGGSDLIFPHHENENAQSMCAHSGKALARTWMHNGMLMVDGRKMSKSDGTFITCDQVFARAAPSALRYLFLTSFYRQPLDFTWDRLDAAAATIARLRRAAEIVNPEKNRHTGNSIEHYLEDDLNTPEALALLSKAASVIYSDVSPEEKASASFELRFGLNLLGLDRGIQNNKDGALVSKITTMISDRRLARAEKRWADGDSIRDELREMGVVLSDEGTETTWSFSR